jgi:hypothetical protein
MDRRRNGDRDRAGELRELAARSGGRRGSCTGEEVYPAALDAAVLGAVVGRKVGPTLGLGLGRDGRLRDTVRIDRV